MPWAVAAAVVGGAISSDASRSAANKQADAANNATNLQQQNFQTINNQEAPYRASGYDALNQIGANKDYFTHQFNADDLKTNLAPNYQFMLDQGTQANTNLLNSTGGKLSGNFAQGLNAFTQGYAGNAYQNAFNNYSSNQTNIYNRLASLAGIGQTGQGATNSAGTTAATNSGNFSTSGAAAQAAGTVGSANAISGALQTGGSLGFLNTMYGNQTPATSTLPRLANNFQSGSTVQPLNNTFDTVGG